MNYTEFDHGYVKQMVIKLIVFVSKNYSVNYVS